MTEPGAIEAAVMKKQKIWRDDENKIWISQIWMVIEIPPIQVGCERFLVFFFHSRPAKDRKFINPN